VEGRGANTEYRCRESVDKDNYGGPTGGQEVNKESRDQMGSLKGSFERKERKNSKVTTQ
jgi:hypothetical protein